MGNDKGIEGKLSDVNGGRGRRLFVVSREGTCLIVNPETKSSVQSNSLDEAIQTVGFHPGDRIIQDSDYNINENF